MFKKEAWKKAVKWNSKRSAKAKWALKVIKKHFQQKLNELYDPKDDIELECWIQERFSKEEYNKLRKLCEKEGIEVEDEWEDPFERLYTFKLTIQKSDMS